MMIQDDGGLAFPMGYHRDGNSADHCGMSLRDWFAGQYLNGIAAASVSVETAARIGKPSQDRGKDVGRFIADMAYQAADAMLAAREREEEEK